MLTDASGPLRGRNRGINRAGGRRAGRTYDQKRSQTSGSVVAYQSSECVDIQAEAAIARDEPDSVGSEARALSRLVKRLVPKLRQIQHRLRSERTNAARHDLGKGMSQRGHHGREVGLLPSRRLYRSPFIKGRCRASERDDEGNIGE